MNSPPILVVHGGAGSLASEADRRQYLVGVGEALDVGQAAHDQGCRAAVRTAVMHMEAHSIMNAGLGSSLALDGLVSMDAGFMVGDSRRYGAVTGVRRSVHPVLLAEHLVDDGEYGRLLAPPESDELIEVAGAPLCEPADLVTERARRLHAERLAGEPGPSVGAPLLDTVGAVALDAEGHVAAAVSTGGMSLKRVGRVGDSPIVGAGFWADDATGACVTTGVGEALMRQGTARRCVQLVASGVSAVEAAGQALAELIDYEDDVRGRSGLILVTREGEVVLDHNSPEMSAGWVAAEGGREVAYIWCR